MRNPTSRDILNFLRGFIAAALLLMLWGWFNALQANPPQVMRLTSGKVTQSELNKRPVMVQAVRLNGSGEVVSDTLNVLFQHRSTPAQAIASEYVEADVIVTCFPSEIDQHSARERVLFPTHDGEVETRVFADKTLLIRAIN